MFIEEGQPVEPGLIQYMHGRIEVLLEHLNSLGALEDVVERTPSRIGLILYVRPNEEIGYELFPSSSNYYLIRVNGEKWLWSPARVFNSLEKIIRLLVRLRDMILEEKSRAQTVAC